MSFPSQPSNHRTAAAASAVATLRGAKKQQAAPSLGTPRKTAMNVSASASETGAASNAVELLHVSSNHKPTASSAASKQQAAAAMLMSPTESDAQSVEVFEDTDSDISSTIYNDEDDPWKDSATRMLQEFASQKMEDGKSRRSGRNNSNSGMLDDDNHRTLHHHDIEPSASYETALRSNATSSRAVRCKRSLSSSDHHHPTRMHTSSTSSLPDTAISNSISSPSFRQIRRATAFAAIVPVGLKGDGRDIAVAAPSSLQAIAQQVSEEDDELLQQEKGASVEKSSFTRAQASFREFALLSWSTNKLSLLSDERMFVDDGPRALDAFLLQDVDFLDLYPPTATADSINPKALAMFCFPDGLRIRILPRVAMPGAMYKGWAGVAGDKCHVLVFTDGNGKTQHGVAITVRQEIPLTVHERDQLSRIAKLRLQRRNAASIICRWWRRVALNRMLKEALVISGCEQYSIDELRAELSTSEVMLLQEHLSANRNDGGTTAERSNRMNGSLASNVLSQWQNKSTGALKKMIQQSPQKRMSINRDVSSASSASGTSKSALSQDNVAEVESLTRNAIKRSVVATTTTISSSTDVDCGSEVTDDTEPSAESSGDNSGDKKRHHRLQKFAERMSGVVATPPVSPRRDRSARSVAVEQSLHQVPPIEEPETKREISKWAQEKGRESYLAMKHAGKHGSACVMEKCYVLVGCRPDEHVLLLGPLQQLVNAERMEINDCRASSQGLPIDEWVEKERKLFVKQLDQRHSIVEAMLKDLRLTRAQAAINFPRNYLDFIVEGKRYFETALPIPNANPIKLPLPLPSIGKQWGLSRLLLDIGPDSLVLMLKLLLMERSILVLGEDLEDVTAIACSLLELLEPFEWRSVFLPVLPHKMLDFVSSPVPFVAGMAVNDYSRVCNVEKDSRTVDAMSNGMSLLNLSTNTLHITSEADISKYLSLDPYLREQLRCVRGRLSYLAENPSSALLSFQRFIRTGFSPKESVTLDSACMALEQHFSKYCGDLAISCTAWKQYGTIHVETGKFSFQPDWFINRIRSEQVFHEAMVHTQLFMGYVDERRRDQMEVEEMKRGKVGKFIAQWIYERWLVFKERNNPVEV